MADTLILEGTHSLELSAKGAASDVRSWAKGRVGQEGARLFINNISQPGVVDTIINRHRGRVGVGTSEPTGKLTVHVTSGAPAVLGRNFGTGDGVRGESSQGHGVSGASVSHVGTEGICESGIGVLGGANSGKGVVGRSTSGTAVAAEGGGLFLIEASTLGQGNRRFAVRADGAVFADGPFTGPADFAEMMPVAGSRDDYAPGDVLVVGADGMLEKCREAQSRKVVGVYSSKPGFLGDRRLTEHGLRYLKSSTQEANEEPWLPVALAGIVDVSVTADRAPIRAGDLLATSETPGCAMRATPVTIDGAELYSAGVILGKALETLESGTSRIRVLVQPR